ncbi:HTH-type transcriptional regulator protein [Rhizobium phage RHEph12]|nr:HTH-type transcriptional regulator protein [Rhizobium phage RHEph12]
MQAAVNLTPRETEVLETMLTGISTNKALAHHLKISSATVVCHIHEASRKFGKTNRLETLLAYIKHKEGKTMERTLETASQPILFICDTYQLPHAPVYWLADFELCARLHSWSRGLDRKPSGHYTPESAMLEIENALHANERGLDTDANDICALIEKAIGRRF